MVNYWKGILIEMNEQFCGVVKFVDILCSVNKSSPNEIHVLTQKSVFLAVLKALSTQLCYSIRYCGCGKPLEFDRKTGREKWVDECKNFQIVRNDN